MKATFIAFIALINTAAFGQAFNQCVDEKATVSENINNCEAQALNSGLPSAVQARSSITTGLLRRLNRENANYVIGNFMLATEKGSADGFSHIGDLYRLGYQSITVDYNKALHYYNLDTSNSITKHFGLAMLNLGGNGLPQNTLEAIKHLSIVAGRPDKNMQMVGVPHVTEQLCNIYSEKTYNMEDKIKAHMWCTVTAQSEDNLFLKSIYEEKRLAIAMSMNKSQLEESTRLLNRCKDSGFFLSCGLPM